MTKEKVSDTLPYSHGQRVVLSVEERHRILFHFNDTKKPFSRDKTIHGLFIEQAKKTPNNCAVIFDGCTITYRELDEKSNRLANLLRELGIRNGSLVGVIIDRSIEMIVSVMGILKAAGAYVPIEPYLPDARIITILSSLDMQCILSNRANIQRLLKLGKDLPQITTLISMDAPYDETGPSKPSVVALDSFDKSSSAMPEAVCDPGDTAYIIFTSGSTGTPKGVVVKHQTVVNCIEWVNHTFGINETDKLLFITSLSFDLSVYDIFGILAAGCAIRLVGSADCKEPSRLFDIMRTEEITFWNSAPQALQQLTPFLESVDQNNCLDKLKHVFLSGDWIPVPLPDIVKKACPNAMVISLGGATEAAIWSNYYPIGKVDPAWPSIPYGKPIQNAQYYILDVALNPLPIGEPGDLYIGGECLAAGYINDHDLTAKKFIENPFCPNEKMYMTGDLARWFNDGTIEFLGRSDFQVKIRGYRVELGEIESVLLKHPQVKEAVVVAKNDRNCYNVLAAYYVLKKTTETISNKLLVTELKNFLSKKLPPYMIPTFFVALEKLPVTANFKVDRKSLPEPKMGSYSRFTDRPPKSPEELYLAKLWENLLNVPSVNKDDDFFDLGGHSLLAVQMFFHIYKSTGLNLPLAMLFEAPTIEKLALKLDKNSVEKNTHFPITTQAANQIVSNPRKFVVPIKPHGNLPPFFCVHGVGGNVLNYHDLAFYLNKEQPLYGLQCQGLDGTTKPFANMQSMAHAYIDEIRQIQPHGPYLIGGGSMGGLVAFEMAQQLICAQERIGLLLMFDSDCPRLLKSAAIDSALKSETIKPTINLLKTLRHSVWCRFRDGLKKADCFKYRILKRPIPHELRYWLIEQKNYAIASAYLPKQYSGLITMFRASLNTCGDPFRGWKSVANGGMRFWDFSCTHETIIEHTEAEKKLAELLREHNALPPP